MRPLPNLLRTPDTALRDARHANVTEHTSVAMRRTPSVPLATVGQKPPRSILTAKVVIANVENPDDFFFCTE